MGEGLRSVKIRLRYVLIYGGIIGLALGLAVWSDPQGGVLGAVVGLVVGLGANLVATLLQTAADPPVALSPAASPPAGDMLSPEELQNRRALITRVRDSWIAGVLEPSLYAATRIKLGLQEAPDVLANPWRFVLELPDRPALPLREGITIGEVYDRSPGSLLILGAPGAGKTTLLLELARTRLARADRDPTQRIPVVFHLTTWAEQRPPLADWLVAELQDKYQVPARIGRPWVAGDRLLLLLDGLDEVAPAHRSACVQAINAFRQTQGLTPLVVCSREAEFRALATPLTVATQRCIRCSTRP